MHDRYRKGYRVPKATNRLRGQIALEAAPALSVGRAQDPDAPGAWLDAAGANDLYVAKRKAAAVLGHRLRPGDLPSDDEVREQLVFLWRESTGGADLVESGEVEGEDEDEPPGVAVMADHLDRFAIYKMRLQPLEAVKQNARYHPEGDALFHSLQVFELARTRGRMMRSSCWRPCCTTSARRSIPRIMSGRGWSRSGVR